MAEPKTHIVDALLPRVAPALVVPSLIPIDILGQHGLNYHPHPTSIGLSLTHTDLRYDLRDEAQSILGSYQPADANDDTKKVLNLFLMNLPGEGQIILASELVEFERQPAKLRQFRDFLVDAILKPSMSSIRRNDDLKPFIQPLYL